MTGNLSRRDFVKHSAIGASAVALSATGVARGFPANEKVQLGWIGVGRRCEQLLSDVLEHCPDARTAALCDIKPERIGLGKKIADRDKPKGYSDYKEMIEKEKLDGILIATWPYTHGEISSYVLQAGIHCFCEKPLETTVANIDAVTKVARQAQGVIYQIGMQRRYNRGFAQAVPMIHSGKIGKITFMQGHWHWPWMLSAYPMLERGGMYLDQSCHHFDVMAWAMGEQHPKTCIALGYTQEPKPEGPNVYSATHSASAFQFPQGQIFSYTHLFYLPMKFEDEKLWVFGEKGAIDLGHGKFWPFQNVHVEPRPQPAEPEQIAEDSKGDWGKGTKQELEDFVDNVKTGGKRKPLAGIEAARTAALMGIMGRTAMVHTAKNAYEPRVIHWKDLGTTTDPVQG